MNSVVRIPLNGSPEQLASLRALQQGFAQVCNALAPMVQQNRCWNRVTLHHLAYKQLRDKFPAMGSQMVCNAIYSVSRTGRLVYQHPESPFNLNRLAGKPLPLLRFADNCPVYFDRHTLSVKDGQLSMYTLDGRIRFHLALRPEDEASFHEKKLREVVLSRTLADGFELSFLFLTPTPGEEIPAAQEQDMGNIPEYVMVEEAT
ncbi:MAG: hypothetical protein A3E79_12280 [Burkholderiales bacterium RIFCSPHIGHO2_12_FULL_61_11]|nr:MAG: hypothetical protein A3E79_12280 [Burkholderiales bacterium RIFCSPHIGHO2_12_FULL_61_11]